MKEKKRLGRPPEDEPQTARIAIRLPTELRRQIRLAAAGRDISLSAWLKESAEEKLGRDTT